MSELQQALENRLGHARNRVRAVEKALARLDPGEAQENLWGLDRLHDELGELIELVTGDIEDEAMADARHRDELDWAHVEAMEGA